VFLYFLDPLFTFTLGLEMGADMDERE